MFRDHYINIISPKLVSFQDSYYRPAEWESESLLEILEKKTIFRNMSMQCLIIGLSLQLESCVFLLYKRENGEQNLICDRKEQ